MSNRAELFLILDAIEGGPVPRAELAERLGRDPSVLKRHLKRGRCRRLLSYTNCEPFRIRITTRGTRSLARHRSGR